MFVFEVLIGRKWWPECGGRILSFYQQLTTNECVDGNTHANDSSTLLEIFMLHITYINLPPLVLKARHLGGSAIAFCW